MNDRELIIKIVGLRKQKGISQQQLADLCGIARPVIGKYETHVTTPSISAYLKMLHALDCDIQIISNVERGK